LCIGSCLASLGRCDYPDLEVIVCDDGSRDRTLEVARKFPFHLVELPHRGLSGCRNAGIAAASGDIVAFLDADATCHPEWPYHLVLSLDDSNVAATGGPNLPVPDGGLVERAVAQCPGNPVHVLDHRRGSVLGFLKQQAGYGRAERMVSGRHPHRFNGLGQAIWSGFIYGGPRILPRLLRPVIYHGPLGQAAYQPVVRHTPALARAWAAALLPL